MAGSEDTARAWIEKRENDVRLMIPKRRRSKNQKHKITKSTMAQLAYRTFFLLLVNALHLLLYVQGFIKITKRIHGPLRRSLVLGAAASEKKKNVQLVGFVDERLRPDFLKALHRQGLTVIDNDDLDNGGNAPSKEGVISYRWNAASGMLQLVIDNEEQQQQPAKDELPPPRWVPLVQDQESVLIQNGWSFLDVDESEKLSAFDVDDANLEGTYRPKWGEQEEDADTTFLLSNLGWSLTPMTAEQVLEAASKHLNGDLPREVLLHGKTDPRGRKQTHNSYDWSGSVGDHKPSGVFVCSISGLPIFSTSDFSVSMATEGWLSFIRPVSSDHIILHEPHDKQLDSRVEVLCAVSKCHLGHYFGPDNGYCINASALNFYPMTAEKTRRGEKPFIAPVVSNRLLFTAAAGASPSVQLLRDFVSEHRCSEKIVFGAGCFWHIEFAIRRLPGIIQTRVGYAGGKLPRPSYEQVCQGDTGHAEVVMVEFDPTVLDTRTLIDCFLALHDPTKVRAHGKHAAGTGQYRSCIFLPFDSDNDVINIARQALEDCRMQLGEISTRVNLDEWFWEAEERHQQHNERRGGTSENNLTTLSTTEWLGCYGRRTRSVLGTSATLGA